ncbi:MAG: DUF1015 domain-containing protein [Lachnospiraceae bacterium]|nr:DUF1015 domain-containing protein [Lachnospiraceae bacterium]MDD6183982.1 DUF1015 domain-containing protein [Lachnospiraceae bacterium]MDD7377624.1 DUF1015 domain-containing protein [Lachnospiraceae bacterium]MDY4617557.1 DUF1015 domain-containing protein [Lachnospiraceae bacterium]MDY5775140.1 DUF1015 domain-containing protein [Lachnospiraceae bacterium]
MAIIKPFAAIRPEAGKADKIAALPYDVYNREEAKEVVKKNPLSFLKIDRAETQFDDSVDTYDERVYTKAHDMLWEMVEDGSFVREEQPCYYIYELTMNGRTQTGITACASIDDYAQGIIKKHENTRADKEADRIHHVDSCNAQTGPIFLAYRSNREINDVVEQVKKETPLYDFVAEDGIRHRVWVIHKAEDIQTIEAAFASIGEIYIADGHHRAASAVRVGFLRREAHPNYSGDEEFNYFLSVLFPDDQLMIMDYNRVVKDLNGMNTETFLEKIQSLFEVSEGSESQIRPEKKGEFSMYLEDKWYLCKIKAANQSEDPVGGLDVSLLQELLLAPVLGIGDPKTDKRIDFVGGIRGLQELERRVHTDCAVAFAMYPTSIGELFDVADAGLLMPPKSTWFEPKLRSGLFIHEI